MNQHVKFELVVQAQQMEILLLVIKVVGTGNHIDRDTVVQKKIT